MTPGRRRSGSRAGREPADHRGTRRRSWTGSRLRAPDGRASRGIDEARDATSCHPRPGAARRVAFTFALAAALGLGVTAVPAAAAPAHRAGAAVAAATQGAARAVGDGSDPDGSPGQPPAPTQSPDEVRQAADDVLDGAEFQRPEPNAFEKARAWIEERVGRVLQGLVTGDGASVLGWIVLIGALVAIAFLLARLGRSVQRDPGKAAEISVERSRTADQWADEAERLEGRGEWKLALRCRFRALVATLVEQGRVDDVPGRTAGEYRAEVDVALPEVAADFAEATYLFEDAWYGDEPTGAAENARFRSLADAVVAVSAKHRGAGAGEVVTEAEAVSA